MSFETVLTDTQKNMDSGIDSFRHGLKKLRTGRASVELLDGLKVDYYGTPTPLSQVASLSVPEPRTLLVQPWDLSQMAEIEKAIMHSDLGLTPGNDGKIIRIQVPHLTEERRKELVKVARKYAEEGKVAVRNCRREANDTLKKLEKDKEMGQDDLKKAQQKVQTLTDSEVARIDEILSLKEAEIMEV